MTPSEVTFTCDIWGGDFTGAPASGVLVHGPTDCRYSYTAFGWTFTLEKTDATTWYLLVTNGVYQADYTGTTSSNQCCSGQNLDLSSQYGATGAVDPIAITPSCSV